MKQKKYAIMLAFAMTVVAASLSGCGSAGLSSSPMQQNLAAKADVTISARFPSSNEVTKSLMPAGTQVIEVSAYQPDSQNTSVLIATLTTATPTATVKMTPGMYLVYATAYNSADSATRRILGQTSTGGEVQVGVANNVNLTFLDGQWTFVDASDNPLPLVLSNGTQLVDFIVSAGSSSQPMVKAGKSSIDYSKLIGGGSSSLRLRFDNNTSGRTYGSMVSQFVGATNSITLNSDGYNLTKKCGFNNYYGLPCDENAGDQIVMISGKDSGGNYQSGGSYTGNILYGSAYELLPGKGQSTFSQGNQPLDLMAALPDTAITGGNLVTGGIVEWKPSTNRSTTMGTSAVTKVAKSDVAVKAQTANTPYTNLTVKNYEMIVCSNTNPQNRGTWSFANYTSTGKILLGGKVCYSNNPQLSGYPVNAGDYSYGLVPAVTANLGDYCQQWDYTNNICLQQSPGTGDVYLPWNFRAVRSPTKTTINYGSFKLNFWGENAQTGTAYVYPFKAKGSTTVKAAPAAPVITGIGVPASVATGTATATLTASALDPNGDSITWGWSIVSGGGTLGLGCSGSGAGPISSSCQYTPPATAASVVLRFSAGDGVKTSILSRTLSVSDGTIVVIQ